MSKRFRGLFIKRLFSNLVKKNSVFKTQWSVIHAAIRNKSFNVFANVTYGNAKNVINYLGRYSSRVAIDNQRIRKVSSDKVIFSYFDYRDKKKKSMELTIVEFARRFLMHILPKGFHKIRHYGFLAHRCREATISEILLFFERRMRKKQPVSVVKIVSQLIGRPVDLCPACKKGRLTILQPVPGLYARAGP